MPQSIQVASIRADVRSDATQFVRSTRQATQGMRNMRGQARRTATDVRVMSTAMSRFVNLTFASAGIVGAARHLRNTFQVLARASAAWGAQIAETADTSGVAAEQLQALARVAQGDGIAFEALATTLNRFNNRIGKAAAGSREFAQAFQELGLDARELAGLPLDEALIRIADGLDNVKTAADRVRVLRVVGGLSAAQLVPILQDGGEGAGGLREQLEAAREFGVATREQADALKTLDQAYTDVADTIKTFGRLLTAEIAPFLTSTLNRIRNIVQTVRLGLGIVGAGRDDGGEATGTAGSPGVAARLRRQQAQQQTVAIQAEETRKVAVSAADGIAKSRLQIEAASAAMTRSIEAEVTALERQIEARGLSAQAAEQQALRYRLLDNLEQARIATLAQLRVAEETANEVAAATARARLQQLEAEAARVDSIVAATGPQIDALVALRQRLETEAENVRIQDERAASLQQLSLLTESFTREIRAEAEALELEADAFHLSARAADELAARQRILQQLDRERAGAVAELAQAVQQGSRVEAEIARQRIADIDDLRGRVDEVIEAAANDLDRINEARERLARLREIREIATSVGDSIGTFAADAVRNFDDIGEAARRAGLAIADLILQQTVQRPIAGFISSGIESLAGGFIGGVLDNFDIGGGNAIARSVGGSTVMQTNHITVTGSDEAAVRRGISRAAPDLARGAVGLAGTEASRPSQFRSALGGG